MSVDRLKSDAAKMMEVMRGAYSAHIPSQDWVVFVGPEGGYQFIADYGGTLDSLRWSEGAVRSWRLARRCNSLVVEGSSAAGKCVIEEQAPAMTLHQMLPRTALYRI